jgi:hypothetical protein
MDGFSDEEEKYTLLKLSQDDRVLKKRQKSRSSKPKKNNFIRKRTDSIGTENSGQMGEVSKLLLLKRNIPYSSNYTESKDSLNHFSS